MKSNKNGFTLIAAVFIVLIITLMAVVTSTFIASDAVVAIRNYQSLKAFYIAEAGSQYYLRQLRVAADWSAPPAAPTKTFAGGTFALAVNQSAVSQLTYTVTGLFTSEGKAYTRAIQAIVIKKDLSSIAQTNTIFSSGTVTIGSNSIISGEVGSHETVRISLDTTYYDNLINLARTQPTYSGDQSLAGPLPAGTYFIDGNVTLGGLSVDGSGEVMVVATGQVSVNNNKNIGDNIKIISAGEILVGNSVNIGGDGLWYSSVGLQLGNTGEIGEVVAGGGTVFITPGYVGVGNTCQLAGLVYSGTTFDGGNNLTLSGLLLSSSGVTIGNNAILTANPSLFDLSSLQGLSISNPGLIMIGWQEI